MFRPKQGRETLLPHSGNGRGGGGGLYGTARTTARAAISKSFIATMFWALVSVSLVGGGWLYCSKKMEYTSVKCNLKFCEVEELSSGVTKQTIIPHARMVRAELTRLKNGKVVNPATLRRSAQRKLGHTYSLVYMEPDSEDDDDESYDSFEDDDDSFDSYDDEEASSEDDDAENAGRAAAAARGAKKPAARKDPVEVARARDLENRRKEEQRRKWAELRELEGYAPIKEPDEVEAKSRGSTYRRGGDAEEEERFPGDAGTMLDKNREEIRKMEAAQGMTAEGHRERSQKTYEEASKKAKSKHQMDSQMKQRGNNLHDRAAKPDPSSNNANANANNNNINANANNNANEKRSPDDPDSKLPGGADGRRPKPERQEFEPALKVGGEGGGDGGGGGGDGGDNDVQEGKANAQKGGGRKISSVGGLEDADGDKPRRLSSRERDGRGDHDEGVRDAQDAQGVDDGFDTLGEFVQAGAQGARRKLMNWKSRVVKNVDRPPSKRTKEEVMKDAAKDRDAHRKGHGHHQKRAKKVARPVASDDDGAPVVEKKPRTKHHHKAFHHKKEVPLEDRHHVHHGYHHKPGEKKIDHGWKHQNRQWHGHKELKKPGTTFSLGRSVARKRKETIDSYVSRRVTTVDFTDSKKWRAGGLWMIILGCISAAFCIVIGNFQPRPKTKKVS